MNIMYRMTGGDHNKGEDDSANKKISKDPAKDRRNSKDSAKGKNNNEDDSAAIQDKGSKENGKKVARNNNDTKEVRKLFDSRVKAGDPHRINGGLSMEDTRKWFQDAAMINEDFGITEKAFNEAFEQYAKGEDKNRVEFLEFVECIELLAKKISKMPQDLYNQLLSAEKPTQGKGK
ncbi:hypothetical protein JTE90_002951 [Oedothorax gibbosus]|uniref:Uncharacterized protein n=1 Tax=Oedothorax gibbosus TaxID=931172 RepID=A0AAV6UHT8_9ARAC|nr:hypothetical protein JTE90_002951 [Oedothorax gibbosus]